MKVSFKRAQSSAKAMSSATKPQPTHTASAFDSSKARSSSAWSRYAMPADVLRSVTASSAWRTNMARRSASVCKAIAVIPHPYSAFSSRTARIRRTAASPLLTTAIRLGNVTVNSSAADIVLSERKGHIGPRGYGERFIIGGRRASCFRLVGGRDNGRIDPHNRIAGNRAGTETRGENPGRRGDHTVTDCVVDYQRNTRRGGVAHPFDVEIQLIWGQTGGRREVDHRGLVRLVRDDQVDAGQKRFGDPIRVGQGPDVVEHLPKVPPGEGLHLGAEDGDIVGERGVGPQDR